MMQLPQVVSKLAAGRPILSQVVDQLIAEWSPEPPPVTVSMSELGRETVRRADDLGEEEVRRILGELETVLGAGEGAEKDAVATGFLEAVVAAIDRDQTKRWILEAAGPLAAAYIEAWDEFCSTPR